MATFQQRGHISGEQTAEAVIERRVEEAVRKPAGTCCAVRRYVLCCSVDKIVPSPVVDYLNCESECILWPSGHGSGDGTYLNAPSAQ